MPASYLRRPFVRSSSLLHHTFVAPFGISSSHFRHTLIIPSSCIRRTLFTLSSYLRGKLGIYMMMVRNPLSLPPSLERVHIRIASAVAVLVVCPARALVWILQRYTPFVSAASAVVVVVVGPARALAWVLQRFSRFVSTASAVAVAIPSSCSFSCTDGKIASSLPPWFQGSEPKV